MAANTLSIDVHVAKQSLDSLEELKVHVTFTNRGTAPLRLNTFVLPYASLVLRVQDAQGLLVAPGSPPLPPEDEGAVLRVSLTAGASREYVYHGSDYFSSTLAPGKYRVQARYSNTRVTVPGEWTGTLESNWAEFVVLSRRAQIDVCGWQF